MKVAKTYVVRGRVQGVGYRYFVQQVAERLRISGYARNLDDGSVEVYALADEAAHAELADQLWRGPRWAEVRAVEECETSIRECRGFQIEP